MNHVTHNKINKEAGVTLLLTMLIISGLIIIALTIAALGLNELRASRAFVFTEPAIGAAQSGAEDTLWGIKRSTTVSTNCNPSTNITSLTNTASKYTACKNTSLPATFGIAAGVSYTFYLYDPNDGCNGNCDISLTSMSPTYSTINLNYVSGPTPAHVTVTVQKLDGSTIASGTVTDSSSANISLPAFSSLADNRMAITLTSTSNVSITATTNVGLPTFPTIQSVGCSGVQIGGSGIDCSSTANDIYSRKLEVTVPQ